MTRRGTPSHRLGIEPLESCYMLADEPTLVGGPFDFDGPRGRLPVFAFQCARRKG